jgi:NADH dehydrogenase
MDVFVAGGSGFVGRVLCRELDDRGYGVTAASRSPAPERLPADVETATVDVTRDDLVDAIEGHDAVVNLVALPSHRTPRGKGHEAVHFAGTEHLVEASVAAGVDRFVQMSGLGVDAGVDTAYFRAKRRAEAVVGESSLDWVVYRPSVVFGDGDAFRPFLRSVVPPVVAPLPDGGRMRIQPIWVEELAPMLADGVDDDRHIGAVYELGGPEELTLAETVEIVCGNRIVLPVPAGLASAGFSLARYVPGLPFDADQGKLFALDNTTADNDVSAFGVDEADLRSMREFCAR